MAPKIIVFDLETLPNLKEVLREYPGLSNYPGLTLKASLNSIICAGYKYVESPKVHCINAWDFKGWAKNVNDDRALCEALFEVLHDADAVVTFNGKRFDWPFFQTRLAINGMPLLPKIKHIDMCSVVKRHFRFFNNRLNTVSRYLLDDKKEEHEGWALWEKVHSRDEKALKDMERYCKKDVLLLERLFLKYRSLCPDIPNYNLYLMNPAKLCPSCGSDKLHRHGYQISKARKYLRYQCQVCGTISRTDIEDKTPRSI